MWRRGVKRVASADVDIERLSPYAESMPLEDQVMDVAVCHFVLCSVRKPERVYGASSCREARWSFTSA